MAGVYITNMKLPKGTLLHMIKRQKGKCYYCGDDLIKFEIDHIFPFSKYKNGCNSNLCLACPDCNKVKKVLEPWNFWDLCLREYPEKLKDGEFYYERMKL
jgi:CRISPR/Cas system Type II protein with McrA/HNH and RuvC-like nuclease domain